MFQYAFHVKYFCDNFIYLIYFVLLIYLIKNCVRFLSGYARSIEKKL